MEPADFDESPNQERRCLQMLSVELESQHTGGVSRSLCRLALSSLRVAEEGSSREKTENPHDAQRSGTMVKVTWAFNSPPMALT